jgi:hypothetical protein
VVYANVKVLEFFLFVSGGFEGLWDGFVDGWMGVGSEFVAIKKIDATLLLS